MAAKKKAAGPSLCEQGGPEIQIIVLRAKTLDVIDYSAWVCNTAARIRVVVTDSKGVELPIADQQGTTQVNATLPPLTPGNYVLLWNYICASSPWQTRTEVSVNGTNRYVHRKSSAGNDPFLRGFLLLDIVG
jgi:hypothetical protein